MTLAVKVPLNPNTTSTTSVSENDFVQVADFISSYKTITSITDIYLLFSLQVKSSLGMYETLKMAVTDARAILKSNHDPLPSQLLRKNVEKG